MDCLRRGVFKCSSVVRCGLKGGSCCCWFWLLCERNILILLVVVVLWLLLCLYVSVRFFVYGDWGVGVDVGVLGVII